MSDQKPTKLHFLVVRIPIEVTVGMVTAYLTGYFAHKTLTDLRK